MLHSVNPYVSLYKNASEVLQTAADPNTPTRVLLSPQIRLVIKQGTNRRYENLLVQDKVTLIIPNKYIEASKRDIILTY